jgi:hypothetical protein
MGEELKILFPDRNDKVVGRTFDTQVVFGAFCWLKKERCETENSCILIILLLGIGSNATGFILTA